MESDKRNIIISEIITERSRQEDLPGSEWDSRNTPGDWVSIITHYVSSEVRRNGENPDSSEFKDNLIKAAAVIIAAVENIETMETRNELVNKKTDL